MMTMEKCRLCKCQMFEAQTGCGCECHEVLKNMIEFHHGDVKKAKDSYHQTMARASIFLTPEEEMEMDRLAEKSGNNADLTVLTDKEIEFIGNMIRKMRL